MAEKTTGGLSVQVSVTLEASDKGDSAPQTAAYAFTDSGRFLAKAPVDAKGGATLDILASRTSQQIRVVIGPDAGDQEKPPSLGELTRRGAQTQFVRTGPETKRLQASFRVPPDIWRCWIRFCWVQGTLLKRIYSSGVAIDYPVCGANVQVWEVEPIWIVISKLADIDLEKLRQYLLNPQPIPGPPDPGPERLSALSRVGLNPQPLPPGPDPLARMGQIEIARPISTFQEYSVASAEFESAHRAALSGDLVALRQSLLAVNEAALRYLICILFPRFVTKTLVTTLTTDRCGRFSGFILLGCNEVPNLYFTASVSIFFGIQLPIYTPTPISCYTYWNYKCGTDVTLYTDSPFAPLCSPCAPVDAPENYVLVRALGNVQLNRIYGASPVLSGATNATNIGQAENLYGVGYDAAFGGTVLPRVEFDSSLRDQNKAMYYQMSYRAGTSGSFTPLTGQIDRKYNHFVGTDLVTSVYNLGPKVVNGVSNLFEIPPALPPQGDWAFPNPPVDLANAQFPTVDSPGSHGKYQLKLDLFDSTGQPVNIAAAGIRYFVPTTEDPDGTIHTADASTIGLVSGNSFIMTVHVDNRMTTASLAAPLLDGVGPNTCGVFRYSTVTIGLGSVPTGTVEVDYTASHPDNFASYSYTLSRGAVPMTPPTTSGHVSAATNPATNSMSVVSLLTKPDQTLCDIAGFAEDLYVAALVTDGWSRLSQYDQKAGPIAFVLAPKP